MTRPDARSADVRRLVKHAEPAGVILALLASRDPEQTVCPSEAARRLARAEGSSDWRARMATVHAAVDVLVSRDAIRLSWKGRPIGRREGPYRIGRPDRP